MLQLRWLNLDLDKTMKSPYFKTLTALLLLATNVAFAIPPEEREALIKFYHATGGEQWTNFNSNWLGPVGSECGWERVSCTADGLHVTGLTLQIGGLTGYVPAEIGQLSHLEYLDLS